MRNVVFALVGSILFLTAQAQKNYSFSASANFDFLTSGLGANATGVGFSIQSNLFTKKRVQLKAEGSLDHCFGDKILVTDGLGNHLPSSATLLGFRLGPELVISNNISLSALYGYTTYHVYGDKAQSGTYKFALTVHPPKHQKMLVGFQFTNVTGNKSNVHFWGISIGSRIL